MVDKRACNVPEHVRHCRQARFDGMKVPGTVAPHVSMFSEIARLKVVGTIVRNESSGEQLAS